MEGWVEVGHSCHRLCSISPDAFTSETGNATSAKSYEDPSAGAVELDISLFFIPNTEGENVNTEAFSRLPIQPCRPLRLRL